MQMQLDFPFTINKDATRQAVESRLETARIYAQVGVLRREVRTTTSWEPREHGNTNAINKATEDVATHNVDAERRMQEIHDQVMRAVSRLGRTERQIIEARYLDDEGIYDYQVMMDLNLREGRYYKIKSSALYKLAFALRLEVYTMPESEDKTKKK